MDTARLHRASAGRSDGWRRDYSFCSCERHYDDCPHCGADSTDSTHRGRCHARASS